MAPSKTKRANSTAAAAPSKKSRNEKAVLALADAEEPVETPFTGILATLQGAEELNEHCREMLIIMATPSLSKAKGERHEIQHLGVSMVEEALQAHRSKLIEAVDEAQKELSNLEGSKSTLQQKVDAAQASLSERQAAKAAAHTAHEQAQKSAKSAEEALKESAKSQEKLEESQAALEKEKVAVESVFKEHFQAPLEVNEGPHHNFLKPFLEKLDLEESLVQALPSSCVKTKEQRGGFDDLVIDELGKAFARKIAAVDQTVSEGAAHLAQRTSSIAATEKAVEDQKLAEKAAFADLEAATVALTEAEEQLARASEAWSEFEPRVQEATNNYKVHDNKRQEFEDGALKKFEEMRDREVPMEVETEAATAGA